MFSQKKTHNTAELDISIKSGRKVIPLDRKFQQFLLNLHYQCHLRPKAEEIYHAIALTKPLKIFFGTKFKTYSKSKISNYFETKWFPLMNDFLAIFYATGKLPYQLTFRYWCY